MKRPSYQFYPGDWRRDAALQACSIAARGLWVELMCVMHDCEPYGHLVIGGKAMQPAQLARLVGLSPKECAALLAELEDAGVFSRTGEGVIYSRRMVRDEAVRSSRAEGGKAGAEHGAKGASHGAKGGRPKKVKAGSEAPLETPLASPSEPPPSSSSSSSTADSSLRSESGAVQAREPAPDGPSDPPTGAVALAIEARRRGVDTHGSDPRLLALADQGVTVDALGAACDEAVRQHPGERVGIGLVAAILTRWAGQAKRIDAAGATRPKDSKQAALERRNAEVAARWRPPELMETNDAS